MILTKPKIIQFVRMKSKALICTNTKDTKHNSDHSCVCTKHKYGFVSCSFVEQKGTKIFVLLWVFRVVFGVRYKHKTGFWLDFLVLTSLMSRNLVTSHYQHVIRWFHFWKPWFWLKKVQFCVLCIMVLYKFIYSLMCLVAQKTQNGFVVLCLCTILNSFCVVCVLYIQFQFCTYESLAVQCARPRSIWP